MEEKQRLIRLPEVQNMVGLGRSSIYAKVADGTFPKPIKLGAHCVAWPESDVQAWVNRQIETARSAEREAVR